MNITPSRYIVFSATAIKVLTFKDIEHTQNEQPHKHILFIYWCRHHWCLLHLHPSFPQSVDLYDSAKSKAVYEDVKQFARPRHVIVKDTPQQVRGSNDCGLFVLAFIYAITHGRRLQQGQHALPQARRLAIQGKPVTDAWFDPILVPQADTTSTSVASDATHPASDPTWITRPPPSPKAPRPSTLRAPEQPLQTSPRAKHPTWVRCPPPSYEEAIRASTATRQTASGRLPTWYPTLLSAGAEPLRQKELHDRLEAASAAEHLCYLLSTTCLINEALSRLSRPLVDNSSLEALLRLRDRLGFPPKEDQDAIEALHRLHQQGLSPFSISQLWDECGPYALRIGKFRPVPPGWQPLAYIERQNLIDSLPEWISPGHYRYGHAVGVIALYESTTSHTPSTTSHLLIQPSRACTGSRQPQPQEPPIDLTTEPDSPPDHTAPPQDLKVPTTIPAVRSPSTHPPSTKSLEETLPDEIKVFGSTLLSLDTPTPEPARATAPQPSSIEPTLGVNENGSEIPLVPASAPATDPLSPPLPPKKRKPYNTVNKASYWVDASSPAVPPVSTPFRYLHVLRTSITPHGGFCSH